MWEGNYGAEPFDLRLTVLRLCRCSGWIVLFTLLGTIVFGGGYYVKNVLLGEPPKYEQTVTCKLEYTNPPVQSGDYYINEMTWNTYVDSEEFREMTAEVLRVADDVSAAGIYDWWLTEAHAADALSAKVASDIHVPSFTVSCPDAGQTEVLSKAVQNVLTTTFAERIPEIAAVQVIDVSDTAPVYPDVRPLRAVILSAVLSCFFSVVFFLIREIGADSIWLPATLRRRYGLPVLGTMGSPELAQNADHLFQKNGEKKKIVICSPDDAINLEIVTRLLQAVLRGTAQTQDKNDTPGTDGAVTARQYEYEYVTEPLRNAESVQQLRQADAVLLVVPAGLHAGKPLEYMLEFLRTQDIKVTAALLWKADETLIRSYYFFPGGRR